MINGKETITNILNTFSGRDGEPSSDSEIYILKSMWLMMLSEFEASIKDIVENYIDIIKNNDIKDINVCLLVRNFHGNKEEELTLPKIISFYKKSVSDISYRNFTRDRVPKYKSKPIENLYNNLGLFFEDNEQSQLSILDGIASTRDSIAHGDLGVQITKRELLDQLNNLENLLIMLKDKTT